MLGTVTPQTDLYSTENLYREKLKPNSFYRFLADHRHEIFHDADYAPLYCANNGRESVPPSILATACVLQTYDRCSDEETVKRATFDLRWCVALGAEMAEQPFAKSTLQEFRAKLILNEQALAIFQRSLSYARQKGYLKNKHTKVAMDTTHILGKGAVKDTYNLLADGVKRLYRRLCRDGHTAVVELFKEKFRLYFGKSFKGEAQIDWDDEAARKQLLATLAADANTLLALVKEVLGNTTDPEKAQKLRQEASVLAALLLQDLETAPDGQVAIKNGVAPDRIIATTDPEMRHGRKSSSTRFDGHKAAVATDTDSKLITAVAVIAGNAHDSEAALPLVEASESNTGTAVETAIGDCAFGTAMVREQFENRQTELVAKVAQAPKSSHFTKHDFSIDLDNHCVTCPAGQKTSTFKWVQAQFGKNQDKRSTKRFFFPAAVCSACPLQKQCIKAKAGGGKTIQLHPREDLLQKARADSATAHFKEHYHKRVVAEHSIARLVQRGIRKSRYFGRKRTLWQLAMAAAVVNLMRIAANMSANEGAFSGLFVLTLAIGIHLKMIWPTLLRQRIHDTDVR